MYVALASVAVTCGIVTFHGWPQKWVPVGAPCSNQPLGAMKRAMTKKGVHPSNYQPPQVHHSKETTGV